MSARQATPRPSFVRELFKDFKTLMQPDLRICPLSEGPNSCATKATALPSPPRSLPLSFLFPDSQERSWRAIWYWDLQRRSRAFGPTTKPSDRNVLRQSTLTTPRKSPLVSDADLSSKAPSGLQSDETASSDGETLHLGGTGLETKPSAPPRYHRGSLFRAGLSHFPSHHTDAIWRDPERWRRLPEAAIEAEGTFRASPMQRQCPQIFRLSTADCGSGSNEFGRCKSGT